MPPARLGRRRAGGVLYQLLELSGSGSVSVRCHRLSRCFAFGRRVGRGYVEESHAKGDYLQRDTGNNLPQLSRYETECDKQVTDKRDNGVSELTYRCPLLTGEIH
nr:MAG TPA: hypothetical protein [Caudoviricetes sp.]